MIGKLPPFGGDRFGRRDPENPDYIVACNNGWRAWELQHDRDLVAPSLPEQHRMNSLVMKYEWQPGLNRSQCLIAQSELDRRTARGLAACAFPTKRCACGFYAYYDIDTWSNHPAWAGRFQRIEGVIEGYGHCVVGSKGFRAENAIISGLLIPAEENLSKHWLGDRSAEEGRQVVIDILRAKFPTVPLYERLTDLLANTPLMGKPQLAVELERLEDES
jgi:hypothetical protein